MIECQDDFEIIVESTLALPFLFISVILNVAVSLA